MITAFIHIPKTGGTSAKLWWQEALIPLYQSMVNQGHMDLETLKQHHPEIPFDTSFTMVRNTWRRMVSVYTFSEKMAREVLEKRPDHQHSKDVLENHPRGIIPFLEWMLENNDRCTRDQISYSAGVEHIIVDNDPVAWGKFCGLLGVDSIPPRRARVQQYDPMQYMTPDFMSWVATNYRDEIERFGFQPPC